MRWFPSLVAALALCQFVPSPQAAIDRTGEGLSDVWEAAYGAGIDPSSDTDLDGFTAREEAIAGTNPYDAASYPRGAGFKRNGAGEVTTRIPTQNGVRYQIEASTDLITWLPVGQPVTGTGTDQEISINLSNAFVSGGLSRSVWTGLTGYGTGIIHQHATNNVTPAIADTITAIDFPQSDPDADQFGMFIRGWLVPPVDGLYTFWIASDDSSELWLSTNNQPSARQLVAEVDGWTGYQEWEWYPEQKSTPILLEQNRSYYFEVYQRESWGGDHLSVAWTRPDAAPDSREIIAVPYVSATGQSLASMETNRTLSLRLRLAQIDSDGDGVSDYEERLLGLDPALATTKPRQDDYDTALSILDSDNLVTIGATTPRAYEAEGTPGQFTVYRAGNIEPLTIPYLVGGGATPGFDYQPLAGTVVIPAGQKSAVIQVAPLADGLLETQELVTVTLQPGTNYALGTPASANVGIDDAADVLYVALLRPALGVESSGYGHAVIRRAGNALGGRFRLSFSGLTGSNAVSDLLISSNGLSGTTVLNLPSGQIADLAWNFTPTNGFTSPGIVAELDAGRVWIRLRTAAHPSVELTGCFVATPGWQTMPAPPAVLPAPTNAATDGEAARFLAQATFGPDAVAMTNFTGASFAAWIDAQLALPPTYHLPYVQYRRAELLAREGNDGWQSTRQEAWWHHALTAPDQLRQRMAWALSQILVISQIGALEGETVATTAYYDMLVEHAFGNFRDLLESVTLSPMMGTYLSMMRNRKPDPVTGHEPDENYAREIMQLFSIGLMRVHPDGSLMLDDEGMPLSTYTQSDIVALAHIFTGWSVHYDYSNPPEWDPGNVADPDDWFLWGWDAFQPMSFYGTYHDTNTRVIVNGNMIQGGTNGPARLDQALDALFNHPNTGPFIARQLIQRFVTSNPGPGFIHRVASVFNDNGQGVRGDLGAVIKAVLLDPDARRAEPRASISYGKPIEPVMRLTRMLRAFLPDAPFAANGDDRRFLEFQWGLNEQAPLMSPSVFNFYQPVYSQPGAINQAGLLSPEFQIFAETTAIGEANLHYAMIHWGMWTSEPLTTNENVELELDLDPYVAILQTPGLTPTQAQGQLIDALDDLLLFGAMSPELRTVLEDAFADLPGWFDYDDESQRQRVSMTLYLILNSPEFLTQR